MKKAIMYFSAAALAFLAIQYSCAERPGGPSAAESSVAESRAGAAMAAAIEIETSAIEARPAVQTAKRRATAAKLARVEVIEAQAIPPLPEIAIAEIMALEGYADALETQVGLEVARGDAWKDAFDASQELVAAMQENHATEIKKARRKGLKIGAGIGSAIVLLLVLL